LKTFIGDAALKGQVEATKNDVLHRYPNADQLRLKQYFLYVVCLQIMGDTKLDTLAKIKAFKDASEVVFPPPLAEKHPPIAMTMETVFRICEAGDDRRCPKPSIFTYCGSARMGWAYEEATRQCSYFRQAVLRSWATPTWVSS
jgi:hypothetical protein